MDAIEAPLDSVHTNRPFDSRFCASQYPWPS
jgi:hypothetical protein